MLFLSALYGTFNNYLIFWICRKNLSKPYNRYQMVVYQCNDGFALKNSEQDRLYCSEGMWLGLVPECVRKEGKDIYHNFSIMNKI